MDYKKIVYAIPDKQCVTKEEIVKIVRDFSIEIKDSSASWLVRQLIDAGLIARVGRNQYCSLVENQNLKNYAYQPSEYMSKVVIQLSEEYPMMKFQAWEAIQFNYFVNHQIAHNIVFIEVESMLEDSVYEFLRDEYNGNVLLKPNEDVFNLYTGKNTIIVSNLITEAPVNKENEHLVSIEKFLVDMVCNKLIFMLVEKSEYPEIYEEIFSRYTIDESKLFRYARRRNAEKRLKEYLKRNTKVKLMVEDTHA